MGCPLRFARDPGRAEERIERLADRHALRRPAKHNEKPDGLRVKGAGKMINGKRSTDPGLSAAERKTLRGHEAQEAIADHESAQKAFHENRERLREARMGREAAAGPKVAPTPELPDNMPIERVLFSTRIHNALRAAGRDPFSIGRGLAGHAEPINLR